MNTQNEAQQEQTQAPDAAMTREDKFFGVETPVIRSDPSGDKEDKIAIEVQEEEAAQQVDSKQEEKPTQKAKEETASDKDDELEDYSERVQKRINSLTWKAKEAERRQKAAQAERDEAVRVTQNLYQRNQQYEQLIATGEGELINRIKSGADASVAAAKAEYKEAYESGNTDKVLEAQEKLINAQAERYQAGLREQDYAARVQQAQAYQSLPPQQPQAPAVPTPPPETMQWAEENPWFGTGPKARRDMTAVAYAKHETLVREEGVEPNSSEYFKEIDKEMRLRFPEYFAKPEIGQSAPVKESPVVAPVERNSGARPRKVTLTPTQVALARKLGITTEQYAKQMLKDRGIS